MDNTLEQPITQKDTRAAKNAEAKQSNAETLEEYAGRVKARLKEKNRRDDQSYQAYTRQKTVLAIEKLLKGTNEKGSQLSALEQQKAIAALQKVIIGDIGRLVRNKNAGKIVVYEADEDIAHLRKLLQQLTQKSTKNISEEETTLPRRERIYSPVQPHEAITEKVLILRGKEPSRREHDFYVEQTVKVHTGEVVDSINEKGTNKNELIYLTNDDALAKKIVPEVVRDISLLLGQKNTDSLLRTEDPQVISAFVLADHIVEILESDALRSVDTPNMRHALFELIGTKLLPRNMRIT